MKLYQISIDDYHVIVSDESPNVRDIAFEQYTDGTNAIVDLVDALCLFQHDHLLSRRKILYQSKPVHEGIPLFMPVGVDDVEANIKLAWELDCRQYPSPIEFDNFRRITLWVYNETKEKYRFTEDDVVEAIIKSYKRTKEGQNHEQLLKIIDELTAPKTYEVEIVEKIYGKNYPEPPDEIEIPTAESKRQWGVYRSAFEKYGNDFTVKVTIKTFKEIKL